MHSPLQKILGHIFIEPRSKSGKKEKKTNLKGGVNLLVHESLQ